MKIKKQTNRNVKAITLSFFAIFAANSSLAFDLEPIYAGHTEYCMTQLNNEEQDLIKRLFSSEITEECVRYAIKKTGEEFDAVFFESEISDQEYRRVLARLEALTDNKIPDNLKSETDSAIENYRITNSQDKPSRDPWPTAPGYKSIGAQTSEKN
tara:strand:+ start:583 stop:1047 length:465 start_codon:yes stop_codon:yes gene_type:complete